MSNDENMREQLLALYRSKKLLNYEKPVPVALHLHECCDMATRCWPTKVLKRRPEPGSDTGKISLPWIGAKYDKFRILGLGENLYECGGLEACTDLIKLAKTEMMEKNTKRVLASGKTVKDKIYRGTYFYYKMACYCRVLTHFLDEGATDKILPGPFDANLVAEFFDLIAYTNHVKCSPSRDLSRPETAMWEECGKHILVDEIRLLDPKWIIVLGKGNNSYFLSRLINPTEVQSIGAVSGFMGQVNGKSIRVIVVPHPSYYRAKVGAVVADLIQLAQSLRTRLVV